MPGSQYRDWYRKPVAGGDDQLIFSENAEAEGKEYFRLGAFATSPDGKLLATLVDDDGSERFKLVIRDLATATDIETVTAVGIGSPVWTSDSTGIVFTEVNDQWRSYRARYHRIGADPAARRHALRGSRRHRFFGRGRPLDRPQPDLHLDRQQFEQRSPLRPRRPPRRAAGDDQPAPTRPPV